MWQWQYHICYQVNITFILFFNRSDNRSHIKISIHRIIENTKIRIKLLILVLWSKLFLFHSLHLKYIYSTLRTSCCKIKWILKHTNLVNLFLILKSKYAMRCNIFFYIICHPYLNFWILFACSYKHSWIIRNC